MTDITIYHNPRCSKSRGKRSLCWKRSSLRSVLLNTWKRRRIAQRCRQIIDLLGFDSARQLMRTKEKIYIRTGPAG